MPGQLSSFANDKVIQTFQAAYISEFIVVPEIQVLDIRLLYNNCPLDIEGVLKSQEPRHRIFNFAACTGAVTLQGAKGEKLINKILDR
jgi:hypothetical protein